MKTGQIIWDQMKTMDRNLVWCMGVHKTALIENGLQFRVKGLSFKGIVEIRLNGRDLYDIKFIKAKRTLNQTAKELGVRMFDTSYETFKELNDIYFDQMMPLLEDVVENRK